MITLKEALSDAQRRRIAIGHFNVSDLVPLKAVTGAARTLKVPVPIGTSEGERDFLGVPEIVAVVASLREECDHSIFLNADHTHSLEHAVEAAKACYDMIGFDASALPLKKNIELTGQAVEAVKSINPRIVVEGELGFIGSGSEIHELVPESSRLLTKTADAKRFVEATKIDVLAPAGRKYAWAAQKHDRRRREKAPRHWPHRRARGGNGQASYSPWMTATFRRQFRPHNDRPYQH